ncbi:hypothetical protein JYK02_23730 [Corallococcus macrosporus]|uniref:Uncharacterized protein n=1 Tax=Corallococcus macrosporus TaxID=35 RepID=A0ABS3DGV9_9BACT|nr:hypothetical protein [Corallococcus macrosporus]MBN8230528.1 hypothetical protein [Corallococcus macrosporus]
MDHFISINEDRTLAYEWTNLRYAVGWLNSRKQDLPSTRLLDPFEIEDGWFALQLPSLQLQVTARCPHALRDRAAETLHLLGLDHHENVLRYRRAWLEQYEKRQVSLDYLEDKAPLVARAVRDWESREGRQWSAGSSQMRLAHVEAPPAPRERRSRSGARKKKE